MKELTGLTNVFPYTRFLGDLSSALTDYRNLRITQLRFAGSPTSPRGRPTRAR
ncbi:MAG: hypothetical protein IPF98_02885 [Gemmatimonadetes bacterium]|nr:hypothetical protein [Gemmatimonadota bacterium]